jgi:hypothetical protein
LTRELRRNFTAGAVVLTLGSIMGVATAVTACAPSRACSGGIFTDTHRPGSAEARVSRASRRVRRVEIDVGRILPDRERPAAARTADRLTLNLFPDVCLTADRERATDLAAGQVQWEGRVPGASPGTVTLIVDGTLVIGTVRVDREVYEIRYLGDGVHAVVDVDTTALPRD